MENTTRQFTYTLDRKLIKTIVQRYSLRSYTPTKIIMDALFIILFIRFLDTGERDWVIGVLGTVLAGLIFLRFAIYFIRLQQATKRYDRMVSKEITVVLNEECISIRSDLGCSELPWKFINKIWKFPEFWIVFLTGYPPIALPFSALDGKTQEFLISQV